MSPLPRCERRRQGQQQTKPVAWLRADPLTGYSHKMPQAMAQPALAKFSEDLARALKEQGTPVESALVSPEDTPVAKSGEGASNLGFWAHLGLSSASSSTGSPPSPREAERSRSLEGDDVASRFLFGGACLVPHTEGSLGSRTLEERVESGKRLKATAKMKELSPGNDLGAQLQRPDAATSLMRSAASAVGNSPSRPESPPEAFQV
eukprot:Skav205277  [mRNA]  locus=scaffold1690:12057:19654:+ [translate_table: standard]